MEHKLNLTAVAITIILCVTGIQLYALYLGRNGTILSTTIGAFCLLIGAIAKIIYDKKK